MEYNSSKIGDRIRTVRKEKGISQEKLIATLKDDYNFGIARNTISQIENGEKTDFSFDFLLIISKIFGCDIGYLLCEYDETTQEKHQICSATGLSESSIDNLDEYKKYPEIIDFIDTIVANSNIFTTLSHYASEYFDSLRRCKELKEKYPKHKIDEPHIHLPSHAGKFFIDMKHEAEERELQSIYKNEVDNIQPLQLYKLQNFFMDFIKDYGKELLKEGAENG